MLISFSVENLFSFREKTTFDMSPYPRLTQHSHHKTEGIFPSVLRYAAIYGSNAAGKSNLINAISTFKEAIESKDIFLSDKRFKGNPADTPQTFEIELRHKKKHYFYNVSFSKDRVIKESLSIAPKPTRTGLGKKLLVYSFEEIKNEVKVELNHGFPETERENLARSLATLSSNKQTYLSLFSGFRLELSPIIDFLHAIKNIIIIDSFEKNKWIETLKAETDFGRDHSVLNLIKELDLGISEIQYYEEVFSPKDDMGSSILQWLKKNPEDSPFIPLQTGRYLRQEKREDDTIIYLVNPLIKHEGIPPTFNLSEESEGTRKIIEYLPYINSLENLGESTIIVDEIERSVHPVLIKKLLKLIMNNKQGEGQLIFTTHNSHLLDLSILRKDEIWFVEKKPQGSTIIYPLCDYIISKSEEKRLEQMYLDGRFGAIPQLILNRNKEASSNE